MTIQQYFQCTKDVLQLNASQSQTPIDDYLLGKLFSVSDGILSF